MSTIERVKQTLAAITNLTDNKYIIEMTGFCIEHVDGINKERIKELEAALKRLSDDYFTQQVEGEEEWQFLDRELSAHKEFARKALENV